MKLSELKTALVLFPPLVSLSPNILVAEKEKSTCLAFVYREFPSHQKFVVVLIQSQTQLVICRFTLRLPHVNPLLIRRLYI